MEQKAGSNVVPLRAVAAPDDLAERTFVEMLEGWRNQQLVRNLAFATINAREATAVRYYELNTGWRIEPERARDTAARLPPAGGSKVEPSFTSFRPFGVGASR